MDENQQNISQETRCKSHSSFLTLARKIKPKTPFRQIDRIITLLLFFLTLAFNSFTLNPIKAYIKTFDKVFEVSNKTTSFCFSLSALCALFMSFPAGYFLNRFGMKKSVLVTVVSCALGFGLRALVGISFNFYIAGTIILGLGDPFLSNARIVILSDWLEGKTVREKNTPKNFLWLNPLFDLIYLQKK